MKKAILFLAALSILTLGSLSLTPAASGTHKERAVMEFFQPVQLLNATLQGEYLFVHDDTMMARGEACTYVYKGSTENPDKLVLSFHCKPETRAKARSFTVRTSLLKTGIREIREIQFAGSTESHAVPVLID